MTAALKVAAILRKPVQEDAEYYARIEQLSERMATEQGAEIARQLVEWMERVELGDSKDADSILRTYLLRQFTPPEVDEADERQLDLITQGERKYEERAGK